MPGSSRILLSIECSGVTNEESGFSCYREIINDFATTQFGDYRSVVKLIVVSPSMPINKLLGL